MEARTLKTVRLEDGLWAFDDGVCRSYLVIGEKRALLLDTGDGVGNVHQAAEAVTDRKLTIVNSHFHGDHVQGNDLFQDIYVHPLDADKVETTAKLHDVVEGDVFDLGGIQLETLEIPGHSYGSIALLERNRGYILSGDLVQKHPLLLQPPYSNVDLYYKSLDKLLGLEGVAERIYPSHGEYPLGMAYVREIRECVENYFAEGRPSEEYNLVIPGKNVWTRKFTYGNITLVVGPVDESRN